MATERGESADEIGAGDFSAAGTRRTLEIACAAVGLEAQGAELLRIGENAIYRLVSAPLVARIARTVRYLPAIEAEVAVTRWLESVEFPAVRLAGPAEQPVVADGRPVTFWELVAEQTEYATVAELGALLRRLHGLATPHRWCCPRCGPSRGWKAGSTERTWPSGTADSCWIGSRSCARLMGGWISCCLGA